jgi:hypothetical protein
MNMKQKIESNLTALNASVDADANMNANARAIYKRETARLFALADALAALKLDCAALNATQQTQQRIAVYALQKFTRIVLALSQSNAMMLDKYTRATLANLSNADAMSNADARATLCDTLKNDNAALRVRLVKSDTTASTQRSSSAIALHAARVCDYSRETRSLAFADTANAKAMRALFA